MKGQHNQLMCFVSFWFLPTAYRCCDFHLIDSQKRGICSTTLIQWSEMSVVPKIGKFFSLLETGETWHVKKYKQKTKEQWLLGNSVESTCMIMFFLPSKMYLNQVLDHFQTKVIVARQYRYTPSMHSRNHFHCVWSRMFKYKKDFVSKNKNANCIFSKKCNSENSKEGPKGHKKLSNPLGK